MLDIFFWGFKIGYFVVKKIKEMIYNFSFEIENVDNIFKILILWIRNIEEFEEVILLWEDYNDWERVVVLLRFLKYMLLGLFEFLCVGV